MSRPDPEAGFRVPESEGLLYTYLAGWTDSDTAAIDTLAIVFKGAATPLIERLAVEGLHFWCDQGQPEARRR